MKILGIETSCDETAAAVIEGINTPSSLYAKGAVKVLSNIVSSQIEIHKKYGGVVPEVAAREHVLNILPVVEEALVKAGVSLVSLRGGAGRRRSNLGKPEKTRLLSTTAGIDAIAVTIGPGLITSLIVGIETAKVLSYAWNIPVIGVNHIEGHIYANWLPPISEVESRKSKVESKLDFPALILTVSGGHTMLVLMKGHGKLKTIGDTRDDAAGEAFDKAAAMLGIGYPGGPVIAANAAQFKKSPQPPLRKGGKKIILPRPMMNSADFNFSFSGLKTALLYELKKDPEWKKRIPEYCHEFQRAVIDVLIHKTIKAAEKYKVKTIMLSGGVSANMELRNQMGERVRCSLPQVNYLQPNLKYTTDNAAMVATAGYFKAQRKKFTLWQKLKVDCNLEL